MDRPRIALVCSDDALRLDAARAFDDAPSHWDVTLHRGTPDDADVVVAVGDEIDGDVRLDLSRPDLVVADVRRRLEGDRSRAVGVVGASGGCGATSVALHIAAQGSTTTCVVDLHPRPSCARRLGIDPSDLEHSEAPIPVAGGFRLLWDPGIAADRVTELRRDFEQLVLDLPRGSVSATSGWCDAVVVVILPTTASASSAVELLATLENTPVALVANRVGPGGETTQAELQRIVGRRISIQLPCSPGLRDREDDGRLLTSPWSPWLRRVTRLGEALSR